MQVKTLLNKYYKFKSFVYGHIELCGYFIFVEVLPRKNSKAICSCCGKPAKLYDSLRKRHFEFIPLWDFKVYFVYKMRRVNCKRCGVKIESVPWSDGKNQQTKAHMQFLASWAKVLSWKEVANRFQTSWEKVFASVKYIVEWGLTNRVLSGIKSIGVDEIYWGKNKFLTLVYQLDSGCSRLLWIGRGKNAETLLNFFSFFGKAKTKLLEYVCSDMWRAYLKVVKEKAPQAIHVLDRFHIVSMLNKAIDEVRASEHKKLINDGYEPILKNSRWCMLKRKENLTEKQEAKLKDILKYNLKSVRAYLLKEDLNALWHYVSPLWAGKFIDRWVKRAIRSRIDQIKKVAKSIRKHKPLILNWFKAKKEISNGTVEGFNNKAKLTIRKSYGFRSFKCAEIALYHSLGKLPEPQLTHRFC